MSAPVSRDSLVGAAFVARDWHAGQFSASYALSCGDFSRETLEGAAADLRATLREHDAIVISGGTRPADCGEHCPCFELHDAIAVLDGAIERGAAL